MKRLLVLVAILVAGGLAIMYSGIINVAATEPHSAPVEWVLHVTMERSVENHASDIVPPEGWDSEEQLALGAAEYDEMCVHCHGAPGRKESELAKGLYPKPPEMDHAAEEWGPAELFWVTKFGIKDTGMPAWGPTHDDKELWAVTAFSKKMIDMTPAEYDRWVAKGKEVHSHEHDDHHDDHDTRQSAPESTTGAAATPNQKGVLSIPAAPASEEAQDHENHDH